jgi:hypothetical protein
MCESFPGRPYRIVLDRQLTSDGASIETYTYALGKVTTKPKHSEHTSLHGFTYPIGRTVYDPNAQIGSHSHSLHFLPSLYGAASNMSEYGSHRVVVLPGPQFWDMPVKNGYSPPRCWHAASCTPLFCVDCLGLTLADLKHDACWRDLTTSRRHSAVPTASPAGVVLPVPRSAVWHREEVVSLK